MRSVIKPCTVTHLHFDFSASASISIYLNLFYIVSCSLAPIQSLQYLWPSLIFISIGLCLILSQPDSFSIHCISLCLILSSPVSSSLHLSFCLILFSVFHSSTFTLVSSSPIFVFTLFWIVLTQPNLGLWLTLSRLVSCCLIDVSFSLLSFVFAPV